MNRFKISTSPPSRSIKNLPSPTLASSPKGILSPSYPQTKKNSTLIEESLAPTGPTTIERLSPIRETERVSSIKIIPSLFIPKEPSYPNSSTLTRPENSPNIKPRAVRRLQLEDQYPMLNAVTDQSVESLVLPSTIRRNESVYVTSPKFYSKGVRFAQVPFKETISPRSKGGKPPTKDLSIRSTSRMLVKPHYMHDLLSLSQQQHAGYYMKSPKETPKKDPREYLFSKRSTQGRVNLLLETSTDSFMLNSSTRQTPHEMKAMSLIKSYSPKGTLGDTDRVNYTEGNVSTVIPIKIDREELAKIREEEEALRMKKWSVPKEGLNLEAKANLKLFLKIKDVVEGKVCQKLKTHKHLGTTPVAFNSEYNLQDRQKIVDGIKLQKKRAKVRPVNAELTSSILSNLNSSGRESVKRQASLNDRQQRRSKQKDFADDMIKVNNLKAVVKGVVKAGEYFGAQEWI